MRLAGSVRERKTLLLISVLGMLILTVYFVYILGPISRTSRDVREQVKKAKSDLATVEGTVTRRASLEQERARIEQSVGLVRGVMPPEEELPNVIEDISDLATQAQVKIQTIFPYRPLETSLQSTPGIVKDAHDSPYYKEVLIQVDALAGYHQLGTFLGSLESASTPLRVATLRIAPHQKEARRQSVKMLLKAYFTTSEGAGDAKAGPS